MMLTMMMTKTFSLWKRGWDGVGHAELIEHVEAENVPMKPAAESESNKD